MNDVELDQLYVMRREQLKELVGSIISPKIVQGKTLNGKEFVSFLEQVLRFGFDLLNSFSELFMSLTVSYIQLDLTLFCASPLNYFDSDIPNVDT
jgi:hypothetical protein